MTSILSLRLALANLRKKQNSCVSYVILVAIAVMLLEAGMILLTYAPGYYEYSNTRLQEPHYIIRVHDNSYENRYLELMKSDSRVELAAAVDCALMDNADYKTDDGKMIVYANFMNADETHEFFSLVPMYEDTSIDKKDAIYIPLSFRQQGYQTGDSISFEYKRKQYRYQVAGFFETTWFGSSSTNLYSFYLHQEAYEELYRQIGGGKVLSARLYQPEESESFAVDFKEMAEIDTDSYSRSASTIDNTYQNMAYISTAMVNVISAIAILISVVIMGIALLVIWFGIANQVQDNLKQIGVLKALGFTTKQIRMSYVLQYLITGLMGSVLGILLSYGLLAGLGNVISASLGVMWISPVNIGLSFSGVILLLILSLGTAYAVSGTVKGLTPVAALNEGSSDHSFPIHAWSLWKGKGGDVSLQMRLAGKQVFHAPRQYITLAVILVCVSYVLSCSFILYHGLVSDKNGFLRLMGSEISPVTVTTAPHADFTAVRDKLEQMEGVDGTTVFESDSVEVEGISVTGYVSDDFNQLRTYNLFQGQFPIYENEVIITGVLAEKLGKDIGDTVTVTKGGVSASYIICGMNQSLNNFGMQCAMTDEGIKRLNPSIEYSALNVYLKEGWDYQSFSAAAEGEFQILDTAGEKSTLGELEQITQQRIADLLTMYGVDSVQYALMEDGEIILSGDSSSYELQSIEDTLTLVQTSAGQYAAMIKMLTVFLILLSAGVTSFILRYMVKSAMLRRKREFGIYKAMGYTSRQLILQTAFSYLPVSVLGIVAGLVTGGMTTNGMMSMLLKSLGISEIGFMIPLLPLFLLGIIILGFVFLTAYISAGQMKNVSVYELFTE